MLCRAALCLLQLSTRKSAGAFVMPRGDRFTDNDVREAAGKVGWLAGQGRVCQHSRLLSPTKQGAARLPAVNGLVEAGGPLVVSVIYQSGIQGAAVEKQGACSPPHCFPVALCVCVCVPAKRSLERGHTTCPAALATRQTSLLR